MATITFENVRDVKPYYKYDPRVLTGLNAVPNYSYARKATTIKSLLEHSDRIPMFVDDGQYWGHGAPHEVRIRLHTTRETISPLARVNAFCFGTISQVTLADAQHRPGQTPYKTVHIEMDAWYFENYPLGYCTGMLCHEFAVHPLGDYMLKHRGDDSLIEENAYTQGARQGQQYGMQPPRVTPSTAGQPDHAFAAYPGTARHMVYQETVLDVASAMLGKIDAGPGAGEVAVGNRDVSDLLKCYLMDVASIQCTNDHRARGLADPRGLATCYNAHRQLLLNELNDPDPAAQRLLALVPAPTSAFAVMKDFAYLLSSVAWGLGPTWSKSWTGF